MSSSEIVAKIKKYMDQLDREEKIRHALSRLDKVDMTLDLLQRTQVGKKVNRLCKHNIHGDYALRIVTKWMEIARKNGILPVKRESPSSSEYSDKSDREEEEEQRSPSPIVKTKPMMKIKEEYRAPDSPPPCSSAAYYSSSHESQSGNDRKRKEAYKDKKEVTSLERLIAQPSTHKKIKQEIKEEIDYNYRPFPVLELRPTLFSKPIKAEPDFNPEQMFKPRNDRAKVFAGRSKIAKLTEVPTLFASCLKVIGNNIDNLEECPDVPFYILKPVLEKCSVKQLTAIESKNPHLTEDSQELWEKFFNKSYPGQKRMKKETFKDAYFRLKDENDKDFLKISKRISNNLRSEEGRTHKTAMIEEAYAPLHIRRKQAKHGTAYGNRALPTASEVSKARKEIFDSGSSRSLQAIPSAVVNRFSTVGAKKSESSKKPVVKKGALMVKTLKMLNMKRR